MSAPGRPGPSGARAGASGAPGEWWRGCMNNSCTPGWPLIAARTDVPGLSVHNRVSLRVSRSLLAMTAMQL